MRRYIDRLQLVAGRGTGPGPVRAGHRERRRPAEAAPLGQLRVWTTLFGPFTVGAWERQAPPRGNPSGTTSPAGRGGGGPFTPLRGPGCCEGSPAVTTPKGTLIITRVLAAGRGSILGVVTARSFCPGAPSFASLQGAWCRTFFDACTRAGTVQQPNPGGVAGAQPPVAST